MWRDHERAAVSRSDLSVLLVPLLDSVPEASGYFFRGGLSRCSDPLLFALLMREGSHPLSSTRWLSTQPLTQDRGADSLLIMFMLSPGQGGTVHDAGRCRDYTGNRVNQQQLWEETCSNKKMRCPQFLLEDPITSFE